MDSASIYSSKLQSLKARHEDLKRHFYNEKGKKEQLLERKMSLENELQKTTSYIDVLEQVRMLLQRVSEYAREQSRQQIEMFVSHCLQYIFESSLEFRIEINEVRGRPEAEFYVISNIGGAAVKTKPQEARGGGIIDIISLALRVAMLECSNLNVSGPIILDEPAKHVSDDYTTQVAEFLKQISKLFDRQVIMVTHNKHLSEIADNWYRVEMIEGESRAFPYDSIIDS